MISEPPPDFHLREWHVQPAYNRLTTAGRSVQIEPKMMQVLLALAAQPGVVQPHAALLATVWPDNNVRPEVLARAVSELRKVFGDTPKAPAFIETIPRVGYRLIAPVSSEPLTAAVPLPPRRRYALLGLAALLAGVLMGGLLWRAPAPAPPVSLLHTQPLTSLHGLELAPALSPEGNRVAFIWTGPENNELNVFVQGLGTATPLQLTDTPFYEYSPTWSPDGTQIAFARSNQGLFVLPALGGTARKVADIGQNSEPHLAWSTDAETLFLTDRVGPDAPYRLFQLDLTTGTRTPLTTPPASYLGDTYPAVSPDGAWVAFARRSTHAAELYLLPTAGGLPRRLTHDAANLAGLAWTADSQHLLFSSTRGGSFALWQLGLADGTVQPLPYEGAEIRTPSVQGERLAFVQVTRTVDLWHHRPATGDTVQRLLASAREDVNPQFSADGQHLAFVSTRSGSREVWRSRADGSTPVRLTDFGGPHVRTPRWTPDGQHLVFEAHLHGQPDLFVMPAAGGPLRRLTTSDARDELPSVAPDGQSVYFSSNREGAWRIWRIPLAGGTAVAVTEEGGYAPQLTADGETLYYVRRDTRTLWQRTLRTDHAALVLDPFPASAWANYTWADGALYFPRYRRGDYAVMRHDLATAHTTRFAHLLRPLAWRTAALAVSPDGQTLAATHTEQIGYDLMMTTLMQP